MICSGHYSDQCTKYNFVLLIIWAVYKEKLTCLQDIVKNKSLSQCNGHWKQLKPWFSAVTSYQYYCEPHNSNTQGTQQGLEKLRLCYETVFSKECGNFMGGVMSELIRRAFSDPFYLRFDYKADCALHKKPSSKKRSRPPHHQHYRHHRKGQLDGGGSTGNGGIYHVGGGQPPDGSTEGREAEQSKLYSEEYLDYSSGADNHRQYSIHVLTLCITACILQTVVQHLLTAMRWIHMQRKAFLYYDFF